MSRLDPRPYSTFEHTADIGLRVRGRSLEELFQNAACGLFDLITDWDKILLQKRRGGVTPPRLQKISICLEAENVGDLFLNWLRELLYIFSAKKLVPVKIRFQKLTETELKAEAQAVPFDPKIHEQKMEVKAVTYHEFKIEKKRSIWTAEVIVDI